jgi:glycerol dehydrogenase-like iron-containing ADH family enzyme
MAKANLVSLAKDIPAKSVPVANVASGIGDLVAAWRDYQTTREVEKTRREQIQADRDVRIMAIHEQAEILRQTIRATFMERAGIFDKSFVLLEEGFDDDNDKKIEAALNMIAKQIEQNPMKQAIQLLNNIRDPNVDEIEI